jgi:ankyrin repeat protein
MKKLIITTIAAVVLVGCGGESSYELFYHSITNANIEAVEQHIAAGADVNAKSSGGTTPLYVAALGGHKEIAELLIAEGANVNAKNGMGATPLIVAALFRHKVVAELLIAEGADVNAKDGLSGETPLHNAAYGGHKEIVELLIANSADVNAKSESKNRFFKGRTPLDSAEYNPETADLLRKHGGKTGEELKAEGK